MSNSLQEIKQVAEEDRKLALFMALEEISRLTAENADLLSGEYLARVVEERDRMRGALEESRDVHAGLAEFLLKRPNKPGLTKEQASGMFADLQRARLAADNALWQRT